MLSRTVRDMAKSEAIHVYLPAQMQRDAVAGQVNIINRIATAVAPSGRRLVFHKQDEDQMERAAKRGGRALFHMVEPVTLGGLTLRRAYYYPFWQIEAVAARGKFDVAIAQFDPSKIDPNTAQSFHRRLRDRVLGAGESTQGGYVFMPLQGRLLQHRSFQTMSPVNMIEATLREEPHLRILATLHPKETYDAAELDALAQLQQRYARFQLVEGDALGLMRGCDYVVTQNSGLAMDGFLLCKQAVLFAEIDFHHIAGSVLRQGLAAAFATAKAATPDFSAYLYWFFRRRTINAGAANAEDQIRARLQRHGWLP